VGDLNFIFGDVAQLVEHLPEEQGVVGSIPTVTTKKNNNMKAILEFNLPDDQQDFDLAISGMKFWSVLYDLDQSLRTKTKYASDDLPQEKYDAYQEIRDELRELMSDNNLNFDMVK
jgi:hypothetical protein